MKTETRKKRVLFICTGNVARSQMAEGLLRQLAGDRFEVFSGGLIPSYVRPNAITVMNELGIDISDHRSKSMNEFIGTPFDYVITVCDHAAQHCPTFPGDAKRIHWSIQDPVVIGEDEAQLQPFARRATKCAVALRNSCRPNIRLDYPSHSELQTTLHRKGGPRRRSARSQVRL